MKKIIKLNYDITALIDPSNIIVKGTEVSLYADSNQKYYVITKDGNKYQIADITYKKIFEENENQINLIKEKIWNILRTCYDPEIPINIVDLGLIYNVFINESSDNKFQIKIEMTFTSPGCSMADFIIADIKEKISLCIETNSIIIDVVFDPPWNKCMMSDQAKLELGFM